jgi:FdhD protein
MRRPFFVCSSIDMPSLPRFTQAHCELTRQIEVVDEQGVRSSVTIPAERALTLYVDKREIVTLMTLGANPELLALGYLRNQRLVTDVSEVESITVDWEAGEAGAGVAAIKTYAGIQDIQALTDKRVITTGCGQGSLFGHLMGDLEGLCLPDAFISQARLHSLLNTIRLQETVYKSAGTVHGCALFTGDTMRIYVEDVGRHNAVDVIAGWLWMNGVQIDADAVFYTTGRLTSEMVLKSAQMGIGVVVSRNGITQMGFDLAKRLGLCAIGRAKNKHYLVYTEHARVLTEASV